MAIRGALFLALCGAVDGARVDSARVARKAGVNVTNSIEWILGPLGGDCNAGCRAVGSSCVSSALSSFGSGAKENALMASGVQCTSKNGWDYGQGASVCLDPGCCGGSCVGACSLPSSTSVSCAAKTYAHRRICPCNKVSRSYLSCAKEQNRRQKEVYPNFVYAATSSVAQSNARQSYSAAWEPILEGIPGCNGRSSGLKEFKFLVALDATWVKYYAANAAKFSRQGYGSLVASGRMWFDHVSYLYEKQFGIKISIGRIFSMPNLESACETNNGYADGGGNTDVRQALRDIGVSRRSNEAGIVRLGTGSSKRYCHSYAGLGGLCSDSLIVNQVAPFSGDRMNLRAPVTVAHEFGHYFGICSGSNCTNAHTPNDVPDIMVWNGEQEARQVRPVEGMFFKFFTGCTNQYNEELCARAKSASCAAN